MGFNAIRVVMLAMAISMEIASAEYQPGPGNINNIPGGGGGGIRPGGNRPPVGGGGGGIYIPILRDDRNQNAQGEYNFVYESADGTQRQETGSQNDGQIVQGGWSYTSPEGIPIQITFVADHGGYQPQGASLPVAPPLPYRREQQFIH